jgi:TrpR family trp operon transcriptional repressor
MKDPNREDMVRDLAAAVARLGDVETAQDFLEAILTPRELEKVALRWRLVRMLREGYSQRQIAHALGVSLCKITRGSRELKKGPPGFLRTVERECGRHGAHKSSSAEA